MKIMISQPMKGLDPDQMKKDREAVAKELKKQGHEVVNTIFTEDAPKDVDTAIYYLSKSIETISKVDALVFMPRMEWSKRMHDRISSCCTIWQIY